MSLIESSPALSPGGLRWFGISLGVVVCSIGYAAGQHPWIAAVFYGLGITLTGIYYLIPRSQPRIIRCWRRLTLPMAWLVSHLLLSAVFFGVVLPTGLLLRCCGHDPLQLRTGHQAPAWIKRKQSQDVSKYFKQY